MTKEINTTIENNLHKTDSVSAYDRGVALCHMREAVHTIDEEHITYQKTYTIGQMKYVVNSIFPRVCDNTADDNIKHSKSATQQIDIYFTHIGMLHAV